MQRFPTFNRPARICVVGVGGSGGNAVNRMILDGVRGVDYIVVNTDMLALLQSEAPKTIKIGETGQGAGGDMLVGRRAAQTSRAELVHALADADLVFVTAGMGGGTGTGAAPVIAEIARQAGALTIGVVTHPFQFEGEKRIQTAQKGIERLRKEVDTLIDIQNDRLLKVAGQDRPIESCFRMADNVLKEAIQGISEIVSRHGVINVDLADLRTVLKVGGAAIMAVGSAKGKGAAVQAARQAVQSSLLGFSADNAKGVIFNVHANAIGIAELEQAAYVIRERSHPDVNFIQGYVEDPTLGDEVRITVVATGVDGIDYDRYSAELVQSLLDQVSPPQPEIPTRRVHFAGKTRSKPRPTLVATRPRFRSKQWGIPAYLRG